tara:strand:+ start:21041 stop:21427 length:387 start_codon:yes stop_codon:yes gene_type:complete
VNIYLISYYTHISCVLLTGILFITRGVWMLRDSGLLQKPIVKVLPHVVDTVLLVSAISLMFHTQQFPITYDWLTVKFVALFTYIVLGVFALRRGKTKAHRLVFFTAALLTYGFIISVALTHRPAGFFG